MKALPNQTMIDVAIMATGNLDSVMQICAANNLSPTGIPPAGTDVGIPAGVVTDIATLQYLLANSIIPGTADAIPAAPHRQHRRQFGKQFK